MAFYERFEWLCEEKGVTPTQAARDVGIRQSVVSMWKKRGSTPKGSTLNKLAEYFEVSTDYLLGNVINARKIGSATGIKIIGPTGDAGFAPDPEKAARGYRLNQLNIAFYALNTEGQQEAVKRVRELTYIPEYRAQDATQSPQEPQEGTDTTTPKKAPEKPSEGE